ncbi:MAG: putative inhibitor of methylation, CheC [Firmicutes bacterium]|nr:putative inhibitor of methylation, CheC [Bacillota bacterium]
MDVNSINPILDAFVNILPQLGFKTIEKKAVKVAESSLRSSGLIVNIGVMGPLKGAILIGMDTDSAKKFASKMMMGMEVAELDSLAQSAISEMGNMVCANACTNFSQSGMGGLDISPPTLLIGKDATIKLSVPKVIGVTFVVDGITIDVYVGLF